MNRYTLARINRNLVLPTGEDCTKYGKPVEDNADVRGLQEKADMCWRLAKKRFKGASNKELTLIAAGYMKLSEQEIERRYG